MFDQTHLVCLHSRTGVADGEKNKNDVPGRVYARSVLEAARIWRRIACREHEYKLELTDGMEPRRYVYVAR